MNELDYVDLEIQIKQRLWQDRKAPTTYQIKIEAVYLNESDEEEVVGYLKGYFCPKFNSKTHKEFEDDESRWGLNKISAAAEYVLKNKEHPVLLVDVVEIKNKALRGKGIGTKLMNGAMSFVNGLNLGEEILVVLQGYPLSMFADPEPVDRFYKKLGFEKIGENIENFMQKSLRKGETFWEENQSIKDVK